MMHIYRTCFGSAVLFWLLILFFSPRKCFLDRAQGAIPCFAGISEPRNYCRSAENISELFRHIVVEQPSSAGGMIVKTATERTVARFFQSPHFGADTTISFLCQRNSNFRVAEAYKSDIVIGAHSKCTRKSKTCIQRTF